VPQPTNLETYVRNRNAAIALGKALFWDMQIGSDGETACATCHFNAGADSRTINQLTPGGASNPDRTFHLGGPNYTLKPEDFPLHKVQDPTDRRSPILRSIDNVVSSQGVRLGRFLGVIVGYLEDLGIPIPDRVFNLRGLNTRRVEPRNAPTVIYTAFNNRLFWDGRAQNIFNGVSIWGVRDENARVIRVTGPATTEFVRVRIANAALASLSVGPPVSNLEMSFVGRNFRDIAKRVVPARPLAKKAVASDDSVLASLARSPRGLNTTYRQMIEQAFQPQWWQSDRIVRVSSSGELTVVANSGRPLLPNEYTVMESNFTLFYGLALQLYQMTLISDDSPVDRYFEGNTGALTAQQIRGLAVFDGDAACSACHAGAETTNNSTRILDGAIVDGVDQPGEMVERMFNGNCEVIAYDQSFYNIGVRPTAEDLGIGVRDPFGNPLAWIDIITSPASAIPSRELLTIPVPNIAKPPIYLGERTSTQGAFKTASLRNIELTAPYFHNGGQLTLRQVVEFYNRGGDFRDQNSRFIDFEIGKLNLTEQGITDLVAFLRALTDPRVARRSAPFDHPQLFIPNGHRTIAGFPIPDLGGVADNTVEIPAVGRNGGAPLRRFLE
jgi:cytochrome c peroxidase